MRLNIRRSPEAAFRTLGRFRQIGTPTAGAIDDIVPVTGEPGLITHASRVDLQAGDPLYVRGWAIDEHRRSLGHAIRFEIDGNAVRAQVRDGQPRPDVARVFESPELLHSGFEAIVETRNLTVGPHELAVRVTVGRRGAAYALTPIKTRFYVARVYPAASAPLPKPPLPGRSRLDPVAPTAAGSILTITGWAVDGRHRNLATVAARIDGGAWHAGWTSVEHLERKPTGGDARTRGDFAIRVPLTDTAPGKHRLAVIGKTAGGRWLDLGDVPVVVTLPDSILRPDLRRLRHAGQATLTHIDATPIASSTGNVGGGTRLSGTLRRSSRIATSLGIVAIGSYAGETRLPSWCTPTGDPNIVRFHATIPAGALLPGRHQIVIDAPDFSGRFVGRAECDSAVYVVPEETTASASGIERITASSTISTSRGQR